MKRSIFLCVVFFSCGAAMGGEPTLAEPQSVVVNPPVAASAPAITADSALVSSDCACQNGTCRLPRRTHTHNVTEGCCTDGNCQTYSVRTVDDEVTRRRWFGGGTVVRKNSRTVQRPVR